MRTAQDPPNALIATGSAPNIEKDSSTSRKRFIDNGKKSFYIKKGALNSENSFINKFSELFYLFISASIASSSGPMFRL